MKIKVLHLQEHTQRNMQCNAGRESLFRHRICWFRNGCAIL